MRIRRRRRLRGQNLVLAAGLVVLGVFVGAVLRRFFAGSGEQPQPSRTTAVAAQ